ncbi:hypothetical protein SLS62_007377 [Diatrype stigma]|uniref:NAD dependent epimerase/dehydratase n=1 Tax=Diatrype stigma TaxID=117547 RepID=A0AAN9YQC5_9PEZI
MGGVESVPTDPSRCLQVIGAGFARTGTVSMQMALTKLLDGPVMHGATQILEGSDAYCRTWIRAYEAKRRGDREQTLKHVREATRGFVGTVDMPTLDFIPEMLELYPEAKVIRRDPERWARSLAGVSKNASPWWLRYVMWPVPGWRWFPTFIDNYAESTHRLHASQRKHEPDPELLTKYNDWVRSVVPEGRLMEMELGQGWEPLCRFLGVPVPPADEPFPRANDADAAERYARNIFGQLVQVWLGIFAVLGVAAYAALRLWL